jgi:hypothetical protein
VEREGEEAGGEGALPSGDGALLPTQGEGEGGPHLPPAEGGPAEPALEMEELMEQPAEVEFAAEPRVVEGVGEMGLGMGAHHPRLDPTELSVRYGGEGPGEEEEEAPEEPPPETTVV